MSIRNQNRRIRLNAFTGQAAAGGVVGTVIRYGVARGVFSNEAGMGSAPIAAAAAKTDHPGRQALISMTGTFLDTIVVCSITGITLVMGGLYKSSEALSFLLNRRYWDGHIMVKNALNTYSVFVPSSGTVCATPCPL